MLYKEKRQKIKNIINKKYYVKSIY